MRAFTTRCAFVVVTLVVLSGCRGMGWGRKNTSPTASTTAPQLPSANATPPGGTPAMPSSTAGPAGSYADHAPPAGYPSQPAGYTGGAPGAEHAVAAQNGPYSESYGGAPAQPPAGGGYAQTPYQAPTDAGYPPPAAAPAATAGYGAPAGDAPAAGHAGTPYADPAAAGGQVADQRYGGPSYPAQPEQAAADRYGAAPDHTAGGPPANGVAGGEVGVGAEHYQPGNTGYTPGQTGYSPPGVPPYQTPATNAAATPRRDPYYRPGGTSDYLPTGGGVPSASSTNYGVPMPPAGAEAYPPAASYTPPANPPANYPPPMPPQ